MIKKTFRIIVFERQDPEYEEEFNSLEETKIRVNEIEKDKNFICQVDEITIEDEQIKSVIRRD